MVGKQGKLCQVMAARVLSIIFLCFLFAGCNSLPREGPLSNEIEKQSKQSDYLIINVDEHVVSTLAKYNPYGLSGRFSSHQASATRNVVGAGDILAISIWEADSGGLFSGGSQNGRADFPSVAVDTRGRISLPYVKTIKVAGLTPLAIQDRIVERLEGKAIEPQAMVNVVKDENNSITLSGDIANPGRYELSRRGDRILDVVSKAGGTKFPARETYVSLVRGDVRGEVLLNAIMENPAENVYIRRNDQVYLTHDPKRYTVLGAVTKPGAYMFDSTRVNVLEAVAHAGGLLDQRADATGLFVFRYEKPKVLGELGYGNYNYQTKETGSVPVIYRIDMAHAKSYFYAQSFLLDDKDSIFVANADSVQTAKFLNLLNLALTPGVSATRIGTTGGL